MPSSSPVPRTSSDGQILIVDDEPHIRSPLVRALSLMGYVVDEAGSGEEALSLLEQRPYQLMVLDMHMPGLKGLEVMERARQLFPDLLIIILTGYPTVDNAITAVKLEAVDYLRKPATVKQIADAVNQALTRHAKRVYQQQLVETMTEVLDSFRQIDEPHPDPAADLNLKRQARAYPLVLDRHKLQVTKVDNPSRSIQLSEGEASVLESLISRPDQVLSCRELVWDVWGYETDEANAESVIRPYIFRLRRKIEDNPKRPRFIRTVRRRGYVFTAVENETADKNGKADPPASFGHETPNIASL